MASLRAASPLSNALEALSPIRRASDVASLPTRNTSDASLRLSHSIVVAGYLSETSSPISAASHARASFTGFGAAAVELVSHTARMMIARTKGRRRAFDIWRFLPSRTLAAAGTRAQCRAAVAREGGRDFGLCYAAA